MNDKAKLLDLAARCEAAEGPDRELDIAIYFLDGERVGYNAPYCTASLDAAVQLVPEGYGWRLWAPNSTTIAPINVCMWGNGRSYAPRDTEAATHALALCAAALRARAAALRSLAEEGEGK